MARPSKSVDLHILRKVSLLYYTQHLNQDEIAKRLKLSRPKISRLLKEARSRGIIQITVMPSNDSFIDFEMELEQKFHLNEVLIAEVEATSHVNNDQILKRQLGGVASEYLYRTLTPGDILGTTWGTTLQAVIEAIRPQQTVNLHVAQLLGGVGRPEAKAHASDLSRRLAQLLNGRLTLLPAPGIVSNSKAREAFLSDLQVQTALKLFPKVTKAFVGIGSLATNPVLNKLDGISSKDYDDLKKKGAIGDLGLRFFDREGHIVKTSLDSRIIGITLEELQKVDNVIAIAGGKEKQEAILGALRGGYIDVLITDQYTASYLIRS